MVAERALVIRHGTIRDLELVFSIQREASLAGFGHIFAPEHYPFPDQLVLAGLRDQLQDRESIVFVETEGRGFALVASDWLQRLFVRESAWGTGVAGELHAVALEGLRRGGASVASLWCLAENRRACRFYEKHGWSLNGREQTARFPPHPLEVGYSIEL